MTDLDPVTVAMLRKLSGRIHAITKDVSDSQRSSQAAFRGVHLSDGPLKFFNDADLVGEMRLSSGGGVILVPLIDAAPPLPNGPQVKASTNLISVTWDGTFLNANRPDDLDHVEIHRSQVNGFAVTRDTTQCGTFLSQWGGTQVFPANLSDGAWYVRLVAVDKGGNRSPASVQASGTATANTWA